MYVCHLLKKLELAYLWAIYVMFYRNRSGFKLYLDLAVANVRIV